MDYRRMGNMELNVGNTTSATSSDQWKHLWKSPRWIVLRIEALVLMAIIISFFLAAFGSCRRWSNRWIVQKGLFAAQALSLSLGTYSIGLMQTSPVKSEMYPIWTVSLFTVFECIDPVTSYNGLDYKGPLIKMVYGICLYCGYVLLMSISALSSDIHKTAIIMLSVITFIKGMHRSLALVQQSRMRSMLQEIDTAGHLRRNYSNRSNYIVQKDYSYSGNSALRRDQSRMVVDLCLIHGQLGGITIGGIEERPTELADERLSCCYDVCVAFGLSHELQQHILGLVDWRPEPDDLKNIDYKWAMRVIEIELAFVYESIFTGNPFLYYYQAKTASFWALASFIGICFVGIAVAASTPHTMKTRRHPGGSTCTNVVETTTADLVITLMVLVSLARLQLMHLIRCCTSYWARVAIACECARNKIKLSELYYDERPVSWRDRWLRLKMSVATSINWFDKYLWQGKIGQFSVVLPDGRVSPTISAWPLEDLSDEKQNAGTNCRLDTLVKMLGLDYIWEVLRDLLGLGSKTKAAGIRLDDDIKSYVIRFLATIETSRLDERWTCFRMLEKMRKWQSEENPTFKYYIQCVMVWQAATWSFQILDAEEREQDAINNSEQRQGNRKAVVYYLNRASSAVAGCFRKAVTGGGRDQNQDRRVAIALSNYCSYLTVSAPELLPGSVSPDTMKRLFHDTAGMVKTHSIIKRNNFRQSFEEFRSRRNFRKVLDTFESPDISDYGYAIGTYIVEDLLSCLNATQRWKLLSNVWVQLLVYAAPYGKVEAHKRHLAQGGEFITHLWALLYHLNIREWKPPKRNLNLHSIITMEDAERILDNEDMAVVAFLSSLSGDGSDELATASKLEDDVRFYQTSNPDVAKHFHIDPEARHPALVLLNKKANKKFTLYGGSFRAYDIAYFVTSTKRAKTRANLYSITTMEDAEEILDQEDMAVVAFLSSLSGPDSDELAAASNLEDSVRFYQTSSPDIAKLFHIGPEAWRPALVLLNKEANEKFTLYDGTFRAYDIAYFVTSTRRAKIQAHLYSITTMDDAENILVEEDMAVVAFLSSLSGHGIDQLVTASKLENDVRFYQTSNPDVARHFHIGPEAWRPALVLLNKEANEKFTLYDGSFHAYDIAYFVASNKRAFGKTRAQGTAPSFSYNPTTFRKQSSEDGRQTDNEIGKGSSFGDGGHGQTEDEIEEEISPVS